MNARRARFIAAIGCAVVVAFFIDLGVQIYLHDQIVDYGNNSQGHEERIRIAPSFLIANFSVIYARLGHWLHDSHSAILSAFTIGIFIVTGLLALYTYRLWSAGKTTAEHQLRAYLHAGNGTLNFLPNNTLRAEVEFRNSGNTPALNVRFSVYGELHLPNDDKSFSEQPLRPHEQPIGPGTYWTGGYEFTNLTEQDMTDVITDKKYVFVWGRAQYKDIFQRPQTVTFRYRNIVKRIANGPDGKPGLVGWWLYPVEQGNNAT